MGLDMYARAVPKGTDSNSDDGIEIHYWRKHHDLHGWMERLWSNKGGTGEFNCVAVQLTEIDLAALRKAIKEEKMPATTGFFFGDNPPDEETKREDLQFVDDAVAAIRGGMDVHYSSWW